MRGPDRRERGDRGDHPRRGRKLPRAGADMILLDNMPIPKIRDSVRRIRAHRERSASDFPARDLRRREPENSQALAATGVDRISIGFLTHSPALDIAMDVEPMSPPKNK